MRSACPYPNIDTLVGSGERTSAGGSARGTSVGAVRVSVKSGPDAGLSAEGQPGAAVSVGTAKDNDLVLRDRTVSRYHLEFTPLNRGIRVEDLGSRNGTFIGALAVERATAGPHTTLRIGENTLEISDASRGPIAEAPEAIIPGIIARSPGMRAVLDDVQRLAGTNASVLIRGETGTGKEVVARAMHDLSGRRDEPFVVVDCGSLPATLVASELFGHEHGAFTGADRKRRGAFELAHGGTLFLDEIGELPMEVQPVLLGALERRRFRRVGGERAVEVDVRVLAATHRDLRAQVNAERFRGDLYYRLAVARVHIPPLRERPEDIAPLIRHFAEEIGGGTDNPFGDDALAALARHRWSGNVRELRNVVEAALAMGRIRLDHTLPNAVQAQAQAAVEGEGEGTGEGQPWSTYKDARARTLDEFELRYLSELMRRTGGNASAAARMAHMARPYLLRLLKRHDLR